MFRFVILWCLVGLTVAIPAVVRTREEIEAFRQFLESTKNEDAKFLDRTKVSPLANPEENSGKFQGDIILDDFMIAEMLNQYAMGRNALIAPDTLWPDNTVVWEFGEDQFEPEHMAAIEEAIKDIEEHTCLKFRYREPQDREYVSLTGEEGGCFANVGYSKNRTVHTLNLAHNEIGKGCFRHATIVHEFMHILGFYHMHSTHDRDNYIEIVEENIRPASLHNFNGYTSEDVDNLGIEYDYVSCLHYSPYAFSENGEPTIIALKEHEGEMGQRVYITEKDWLRINRQYGCPGAWD